jgi:G:T-mismatch repair DNA endonuclease (very short patch repair protein)
MRVYLNCPTCDSPFLVQRHEVSIRKYCSGSCRGIASVKSQANKQPTIIETLTYQALTELNISFDKQYRVGKFVCDVFIPERKLVIEVQGDYWHGNPRFYSEETMNKTQRVHFERDKKKREAYNKAGLKLIELWESDIKEFGAKQLLEKFLF